MHLVNFDVKLEEEGKALLLLASLPESYDHLVTTLIHRKTTLVLEEVSSALLSYNQMKKENKDSNGGLLTVRSESSNRGRSMDKKYFN